MPLCFVLRSLLRPSGRPNCASGDVRGGAARALVLGASLLASGCMGYGVGAANAKPTVLSDAERDLDCPQTDIRVTEQLGGVFEAVGCGRTQRYKAICEGVKCSVARDDQPLSSWKDRPPMGDPAR